MAGLQTNQVALERDSIDPDHIVLMIMKECRDFEKEWLPCCTNCAGGYIS